jgi:hypothetical protein
MTPFQHKLWADKADAGDGQFAIALALLDVAHAINQHRTDHPLLGETFSGIQDALDGIALAIDEHRKDSR